MPFFLLIAEKIKSQNEKAFIFFSQILDKEIKFINKQICLLKIFIVHRTICRFLPELSGRIFFYRGGAE